MKREVTLAEISDGRLYGLNDMVKADCNDCNGCSSCCRGMGSSIVLDPLDIWRLTKGLACSFEELLTSSVELNVVDGVILPNLKMNGETGSCSFLNEVGRCRIHEYRPGICRLFPLGRYYEDHSFQYFLQIHECKSENRTKIKVRKWIDTPDLKQYETYINAWHDFQLNIQERIGSDASGEFAKNISIYLLKLFYLQPYVTDDFYQEFNERMESAAKELK